jgi:hypothetical protein
MVGHATWPHFLSHHPKELGENENEAYVFFPLNLGKMGIEESVYTCANWTHFLGQVAQRREISCGKFKPFLLLKINACFPSDLGQPFSIHN